MGYVVLTTHPHGSNDSAGYKSRLEQHPATQQNKKILNRRHDRESRLVFNTPTVSSWPGLQEDQDASKFHNDSFLVRQCSTKCAFLARIFLELQDSPTQHPITPPTYGN